MPQKNPWIKFLEKNGGKGLSRKQLSAMYKCSRGGAIGGKAAKGALAALLQGLNANVSVK